VTTLLLGAFVATTMRVTRKQQTVVPVHEWELAEL